MLVGDVGPILVHLLVSALPMLARVWYSFFYFIMAVVVTVPNSYCAHANCVNVAY